MYIKKYDKYYRRIYKNDKFPFAKLQENARGNKSPYSSEEKTLLVLANNINEISFIVGYLNDSKLYLYYTSSPSIKTKVPNARYLNYHMHNYLNNIYILKARMLSFLQRIKRATQDIEIKRDADSVYSLIDEYFSGFGRIRNAHTHRARYIDKDILTLETVENVYRDDFLNIGNLIKKRHISMASSEVKKSWLEFIKSSNISINALVSEYFDFITELILDKNGSIRIILRKYPHE